jgi:hypothetical protein
MTGGQLAIPACENDISESTSWIYRSFQMHRVGKLDGFDANLNTIYKEEI